MARKTIVFEATTPDGQKSLYVAPTKAQLKKALETDNVKIEIKSLGQHEVNVIPDSEGENKAEFDIKLNDSESLTISPSSGLGYKFLRDKFQPQVDKLESELINERT